MPPVTDMMKRFVFLLLALALLALPGCHNEMDDLLGTWQAKIDVSHVLLERLEDQCPGITGELSLERLAVVVELTFYADSTYRAQLNTASVTAACQAATPAIESAIWAYWENLYAQQAPGASLEAYLAELKVTRRELLDEVMGDTLAQELLLDIALQEEGQFSVSKGKLRFSTDLAESPEEESYHTYRVSGKSLTVSPGSYASEAADSYYHTKLPLKFTKK